MMAHVSYRSSRARDSSPPSENDKGYYWTQRLIRTNPKRAHLELYDDDEHDDYPYSNNKAKASHALVVRQQSPLESYNIWPGPFSSNPLDDIPTHSEASDEDEGRVAWHRYTTGRHSPLRYSHSYDEDEREFRFRVEATFGRRKPSYSQNSKDLVWRSDMVRRKNKWIEEEWEVTQRERRRHNSIFDEEPVKGDSVRFRRMERTRTNEWKPLSGWKKT